MNQSPQTLDPAPFLARIAAEATRRSLTAVDLPGGLLLLARDLNSGQRRQLLARIQAELGPAGLAAAADQEPPELTNREPLSAAAALKDADDCQVSVEERLQLFACFNFSDC